METKAGAVLGFALPPREGDYGAGHRLQALGMLEVANAIDRQAPGLGSDVGDWQQGHLAGACG